MSVARLPVTIRLPLMSAALMVLVGVVANEQMLAAVGRIEEARLRDRAQMHVEGLSLALGPHALRRDIWEVFDLLDRAARRGPQLRLLVVADPAGQVLAASDPRRAPIDADIAPLAAQAMSLDELRLTGAEQTLRLVAPLVYQGRHVGELLTEIDIADIRAARRRLLRLLLVGNALLTGAVASLGYIALRRALRPVGTLTRYMLAAGERPAPIPAAEMPRTGGEMARLAASYNRLAGALAEGALAERHLAERERLVSLGRLASSLAHEINNPLGGLLNATDTIRSYPERPEVVHRSAEILHRGLIHLRDVTRATLDHNRIDRAGRGFRADDLDDLRLLVEGDLRRRRQTLDWPGPMAPTAIPASPLRQVLLNLLLNASAAAGEGGRVGLDWHQDRVCVRDSGPGFDPADEARLMGAGGDADAARAGVGLRLVRELVAGLGGRVAVAREAGETVVTVFLAQAA